MFRAFILPLFIVCAYLIAPARGQVISQPAPAAGQSAATAPKASAAGEAVAELVRLERIGASSRTYLASVAPTRLAQWEAMAARGDGDAMLLLARCHAYAIEPYQYDAAKARALIAAAAEAGCTAAMLSMSGLSLIDSGDRAAARQWITRAQAAGRGFPVNKQVGIEWLRKSARAGNAQAQKALKENNLTW